MHHAADLRVLLIAALLASATTVRGTEPSCDGLKYQEPLGHEVAYSIYTSIIEGKPRSTTVDGEQFASSPEWSPVTDLPPPVSVNQAVHLSREVLRNAVSDPNSWGLSQVTLDRTNKYWLWLVSWRPEQGGSKDYLQVPVLLTGRALPPAPEPPFSER